MDEWGWHYKCEHNINTLEEMIADISTNHMESIAVLIDTESNNTFMGTFAILECDLNMYAHLSPWLASLYVEPEYRRQGIGKLLVDFACDELLDGRTVYLWCYQEREKSLYERWGFVVHSSFVHCKLNQIAYVMSRDHHPLNTDPQTF
jgi:GNAT superfamily N-acetyltransferase